MIRFLMLLVMSFAISVTSIAKTQEVYATINSSSSLNLREGPSANHPVIGKLAPESTVTVLNIDEYDDGWVFVMNSSGEKGYVSTKYLRGNYLEKFSSKDENISWFEKISLFFVRFFELIFRAIASLGWFAFFVFAIFLALSSGIIHVISRRDSNYSDCRIYYILYFASILPTMWLLIMSATNRSTMTRYECILSFMFFMVFALLSIFGGWGIRESGMIDGKYHKNANRYVGQILQFPAWFFVSLMFYITFLDPIVDWSATALNHDGGFWSFFLGIAIGFAILAGVLLVWVEYVVPYVLKTAGIWPITMMTVILWFAMAKIAYNWAYANYDGLVFCLLFFFGGCYFFMLLIIACVILHQTRCPMCHNCNPVEDDRVDHGVRTEESTGWTNILNTDENIKRKHASAEVINAQKRVRTTTVYHDWTSIQMCPNCGKRWSIKHKDILNSESEDLEYKWTERYKKS